MQDYVIDVDAKTTLFSTRLPRHGFVKDIQFFWLGNTSQRTESLLVFRALNKLLRFILSGTFFSRSNPVCEV